MTEPTLESLQSQLTAALASITKLEGKNSELIDREKAAKKAADAAEAAREEAANEAAAKSGDIETVKAALEKKHATALAKITADLAARDTRLGELLIDNAIKESITTNKVAPQYAKAVEAMLRVGVKIENGEAVNAEGIPLSEANAAFFKSADAKHFVSAPDNAGAGAAGSTARISTMSKVPETADEWSAYMKLANENPAEASALADKWGRPDMKP